MKGAVILNEAGRDILLPKSAICKQGRWRRPILITQNVKCVYWMKYQSAVSWGKEICMLN